MDFAIYILADPKNERAIRNLLRLEPRDAQYVDQTTFGPLRMRAIAVNVETKMVFSGGEAANVQLASWIGAGLFRLRQMLANNKSEYVPIPTLLTLSRRGHHLYLTAFQKEDYTYGKQIGMIRYLMGGTADGQVSRDSSKLAECGLPVVVL